MKSVETGYCEVGNNESVPTVDKLIYLADLYEVSLDEQVVTIC